MILQEATEDDLADPCFKLAQIESQRSPQRFKLGAVIKKGKTVLSKGFNHYKTHPKYATGKWGYFHAEGHAIARGISMGKDLEGAIMYVYRKGNLPSKPCPRCFLLMQEVGIKKVIYTW